MQKHLYALLLALAVALAGCAQKTDDMDDDTTPPPGGDDDGGEDDDDDETPGDAGVLKLGTMMPLTGPLNSIGPSMEKGAKLAISEVNAANLGLRIDVVGHEDDGTVDTTGVPNKFNRLVAGGAQVIVGPCCSGVTGSILDLAVQNEVIAATPSATAPKFTTERDNEGFFWRIPVNDGIQGRVLAELMDTDGATDVAIIAVNNNYGNGLAAVLKEQLTGAHGITIVADERHDEGTTTFSTAVDAACGKDPKAIALVTYTADGAQIVKEMFSKGCLDGVKLYGSEGVYDPASSIATQAGKDAEGNFLVAGMRGSAPQPGNASTFGLKYKAAYPAEDPQLYAAESYDAVMYAALAAVKAGKTDAPSIRDAFHAIANPPGQKCSEFAACAALVKAGQDIDYAGHAHDYEFDERFEPGTGLFIWWEVQADGTMKTVATGKSA